MPRDGHLLPVGEGRPSQTIGNQLYQFAATLGLAASRGEDACLPSWDYAPFFSLPPELFDSCEGATEADTLVPWIDPRAACYLQDHSLFADIMPMIRAYLAPSLRAQDEINACHDFWALRRPVLACHVRRGDNAPGADPATPEKWRFHGCPDADYYRRAIDLLRDDAASIALFSDDPEWASANIDADYVHFGTPRPKEDQPGYADEPRDWLDWHLLAACDGGHVCSNSTYGVFAALVAGGPAIVPTPFFGPELSYIDASRLHPSDWVRLPC